MLNFMQFSFFHASVIMAATSLCFVPFLAASEQAAPPSPWEQFLPILNKEVLSSPAFIAPFSQAISEDLLMLNDNELSSIKKRWEDTARKSPKVKRQELRQKANEFFYQEVKGLNEQTFTLIETAAKSHRDLQNDYRNLANSILAKVRKNSVAKLESVQNYDQSGQIGYCFGRAMLIHLYLLQAGVKQDDLAKIFVVGQILVESQIWRFHVAIMVRDAAAGFLVVDPLQSKAMPYKEWIDTNARYDIKGRFSRARFYVTEPRKFLPSFASYDLKQLNDPILKKYFDDLGRSL